jgi:hypothetical protein
MQNLRPIAYRARYTSAYAPKRTVLMFPSSIDLPKSTTSPQSRFNPAREMPRRIAHGGMAWATTATDQAKLYQPQDGAADTRSRVADIASRLRKMAGEPEDARITGGTRSLMRRLSGLNVGMDMVRRARAIKPQSVVPNMQLTNANVA